MSILDNFRVHSDFLLVDEARIELTTFPVHATQLIQLPSHCLECSTNELLIQKSVSAQILSQTYIRGL